jgi:predicted  nucleic acid-binding Zn-ribbon protein
VRILKGSITLTITTCKVEDDVKLKIEKLQKKNFALENVSQEIKKALVTMEQKNQDAMRMIEGLMNSLEKLENRMKGLEEA